jgi:lipoyl(octanoyl) transferase
MGDGRSELWTCRLGTVPWADALAMQESVRDLRQANLIPDTLLLLEHPPTVTLGRRADESEIPAGREHLKLRGIAVHDADRGGRITCHEAGQLVGYPIMRTTDVTEFVRRIERAIVAALAESGVEAGTSEGLTGVWCEDRKIGSIGIHVQKGVTTHGFAINCDNDLETFQAVVPCGLPGVEMTSIVKEGGEGGVACLRHRVGTAFAGEHGLRQRLVSPARLGLTAPIATADPCKPVVNA